MKRPSIRKWSMVAGLAVSLGGSALLGQQPKPAGDSATKVTAAEPARLVADETDAPLDSVAETIVERYPDGRAKIERTVTQDSQGNYVHDGPWKMWDERGAIMVEGGYEDNKRHGIWNRWYRGHEAEFLSKSPYKDIPGPFVSQVTYRHGALDGMWTVYDSKQHKISAIEFSDGLRDGTATWYAPNGRKLQEITYKDGVIDGKILQWSIDGKLISEQSFEDGRRIAQKTEHHKDGKKKSTGVYLHARMITKRMDDWWEGKMANYTTEGKDEKHGPWVSWYPNGQKEVEGEYRYALPVGKFIWWYQNGQKRLEGYYENGKQQGEWTWWHTNGQKMTEGEYQDGSPSGKWRWWKPDGQLTQHADFSHSGGSIVGTQKPSEDAAMLPVPLIAPEKKSVIKR